MSPSGLGHGALRGVGLAFALIAAPLPASAQTSGRYVGQGSGADLTITVQGRSARAVLQGVGCIGEAEGVVQPGAGGRWSIRAAFGQDICTLTLTPGAGQSFVVTQSDGCEVFHGFRCSFDGSVRLAR